jgi:signal transduction histidine kinase
MKLKKYLEQNKEIAQLIYGVILIILIPLLMVFNTVFIIKSYNSSVDVILQRHALTMGRSISKLMDGHVIASNIQLKLDNLVENNSEILDIAVLVAEDDNFKVLASSNKESVDTITDSYYYKLASMQPEGDALATASKNLSSYNDDNIFSESSENFWLIAMPLSGEEKSILTIKLSSEIVTQLTRDNQRLSMYILIATIVIVIMFLFIAVRLWDYVFLYRKSKELDNLKNEFISMASHELRTPVTGIRGYAEMMLDGSFGVLDGKLKDSVKMVKGAADRLSVLVEDLLNVSRIEQNRVVIDFEKVNIYDTVSSTIDELMVQAQKKNLKMFLTCLTKDLPLVNIDTDKLKQVLINLIGNSIKYTETGKVEVYIEAKEKTGNLDIKIKDTGIGMSAKAKTRLFEKFYRIQNDKTRNIRGTGLGLWITKQLVELMKGSIHVESIEGTGTQITVSFPIVQK